MTILERPTDPILLFSIFQMFVFRYFKFRALFSLSLPLQMRYVAAALLSALGGGAITEANLKHVLDSVGIEYDAEKAKKVIKSWPSHVDFLR